MMDSINFVVLGLLLQEEKHGYELFKEITNLKGIGQIYTIKIGRLYSILKKLEDKAFVVLRIDTEGNRPARKVYKITRVGIKKFTKWMTDPIIHGREIRISFLLKLFFIRNYREIDHNEVIQNQIKECERWLTYQNKRGDGDPEIGKLNYFVNQFRKSQIEGYITWLNWCKRSLDNV